jgi:hypothetical protein
MTMKDYVLYLQEYSAHFGLLELIRFNVKVGENMLTDLTAGKPEGNAKLCSGWRMKWR